MENNATIPKKKKASRFSAKLFFLPISLILLLFFVIFASAINLISHTTKEVHAKMHERLQSTASIVDLKLESLFCAIEAVAPMMSFDAGYDKQEMLDAMNSMRSACGFDFVVRTNADGIAFNYLGKENIDLSKREYFQKALTGTRAIELVSSGAYDTANSYVILAVPIYNGGKVEGVFHGSYTSENFAALLDALSEDDTGGCDEICIITNDGTPVASSGNSYDPLALAQLCENAKSGKSVSDTVYYDLEDDSGTERHYYMCSLNDNIDGSWYIVSRMKQGYISEQTAYARYTAIAMIYVAICVALALIFIVISRQKLTDKIKERSASLVVALDEAKKADIAKSRFLSRMSHEIRTPLNAVIGYNAIAQGEMSAATTDEERRQADMKILDCLTKSEIASKHLLTVINDILDMSAIESGKVKVVSDSFDFKVLINSLTLLFFSQAKAKNIAFEVVFDSPTEEWYVGDQLRINQILTNLLSNAVKFTPEGGSITLFIQAREANEGSTTLHFEVTDTGIGMSDDYLAHIWTPFEQADSSISRRFGGTGLGMSITKNLVDLMGGSISAKSKVGCGTTFTVELTLLQTRQPENNNPYDFSDINALIVDDDSSTCDYISLLFERCGAHATAVNSGSDAQKVFSAAKNKLAFNLCIIDWQMPGIDGIETAKRLRKLAGANIPIIVITAYDYSEIAAAATKAGIDMFISKPLFQSSLLDMLATISGKKALQAVAKSNKFDFSGNTVLLAEDNKMNMEIAQRILQSVGLNVDCVWNGREAVEQFRQSAPGTYRAILMDIHMPELDGHQASKQIRALSHPEAASIPIIAMTADAFAEDVAEAYESGMNDHIAKPIDIQSLFATLDKYMA